MTVSPPIAKATAAPGRRAGWAIAATTGVVGAVFAVLAFRDVPTFEGEFGRLAQTEARGIKVWQSIVTESEAGKISDAAAADRIDRELLPVWREARAQVARIQASPWADRLPKQLPDAFRLREEAWAALAVASRTGDKQQARRSQEVWAEAEKLVAEIRGGTARQ